MNTSSIKVSMCPVCNGTQRQAYTGHAGLAGYDKQDQTIPCQNCGGQYMFGTPLGMVRHNVHDQPCTHEYKCISSERCLHTFKCIHCEDTYQIDSGD